MRKLWRLCIAAALVAGLFGCSKIPERPNAGQPRPEATVAVDPEKQLLCAVESREAAEALAEQYGIVLVEYEDGLACFYTEEDPQSVISRGKEADFPELSLNRILELS